MQRFRPVVLPEEIFSHYPPETPAVVDAPHRCGGGDRVGAVKFAVDGEGDGAVHVAFSDGEEVVMAISDEDGGAEVAVRCGRILCECFRRGVFCTLNYSIEPSVFSVKIAVIAAFDLSDT